MTHTLGIELIVEDPQAPKVLLRVDNDQLGIFSSIEFKADVDTSPSVRVRVPSKETEQKASPPLRESLEHTRKALKRLAPWVQVIQGDEPRYDLVPTNDAILDRDYKPYTGPNDLSAGLEVTISHPTWCSYSRALLEQEGDDLVYRLQGTTGVVSYVDGEWKILGLRSKKPKLLPFHQRDFKPLLNVLQDYLVRLEVDGSDELSDHKQYIFEAAMEALYGKGVWDWIREKSK